MKFWLADLFEWVFAQEGFSWREWRTLSKEARRPENAMPSTWTGDW